MTNKNILIAILVMIIALGGYFYFLQNETIQVADQNTSQQKINVDQVCEESLMFMTFTDGAAAELFVKECKEGKHPQVIEDYKARMNLGAGAEI